MAALTARRPAPEPPPLLRRVKLAATSQWHSHWEARHDDVLFDGGGVTRPGSEDYNLHYVDLAASSAAEDEYAAGVEAIHAADSPAAVQAALAQLLTRFRGDVAAAGRYRHDPGPGDEDIADLLWALAYVAGEIPDDDVEAAWNPDFHPRWPKGTPGGKGGQFRERLAAAIEGWVMGDRSADPLAGFTHDQLLRTARRRGVEVPSAATRDEVSGALLRSVLPEGVEDEPVRPDGDGALGEVPAGGVRRDEGPGEVLPGPGQPDRGTDLGPGGSPGGDDSGGPAVPGTLGEDDGGPADGGAGDTGGDAAEGGGRRDDGGADAEQRAWRVDATQVFRPRSQADLAPSTDTKRLDANLEALRVLRQLQDSGRSATAEDQAKLARWSGWGSLPNVFKEPPPRGRYAAAQAELKDLLTPGEFAAARRTTRNAHYTDAGYVAAIWDAMVALGFEGGQVLEPGSGSGTFMGMVPEIVSDATHVTGVELDPVTAAIAQALYPNQDVRPESFAETRTPDGAFDAAIGNVPFSDTKLSDPEYNPGRKHNMHNHFILKSLRMTRPGGIGAFITSRYTMDSMSPAAREEMADLADLVGAVRLPSRAHQKAAGTAVVTDLLIFRRREPDTPYAGLPFRDARKVDIDDREVTVNGLFLDNPDMVLGTMVMGAGMKDAFGVRGDADAEPALREALDRVVARGVGMGLTQTPKRSPRPTFARTGPDRVPEGFLRSLPDATFSRVTGGVEQPYQVPATQREELRQLLRLRDTSMALVAAEAASGDDTAEMKRLREDLNETYDGYVVTWGPVSRFTETRRPAKPGEEDDDVEERRVTRRRPPQGGFRADPFSATVRALENYDPLTGTATKTDIFHRRTIAPRTPRTTAENAADALAITMDQLGEVDLANVADLLNVDEATARQRLGTLVFDEPGGGRLVPAAEYLSGNVRGKLDAARLVAVEDATFAANVEALERVLPPNLTPVDINVKMGAGWIAPKYVQQFLREILRDPTLSVERTHGNKWSVKSDRKRSTAATTEWGIRELNAVDLAEDILEQKPISVTVDGKLNQDKTEQAQAKAVEMADRFAAWLWENPDRQRDLQDTYNRRFNSLVLRSYDDSDMELPGLSREGYYAFPHRNAAVRRIIAEPSVGLWHEVGAGKTTTMVIGAMEMRRLGLVKKPAIVVPNHMLEQMTSEFLERYPQARVLAVGADDLKADKSGDKRREIVAKAATGDWDAVILTQGAFKRIPVSSATERDYLAAEVEPLRRSVARRRAAVVQAVHANNPGADDEELAKLVAESLEDDPTVKELEGLVEKAEERIKEQLGSVDRDPGLTFESTGIDYLFVDEAHTYKNLRTASAIQGMGIPGSQIATDLNMKLHHLRSRYDRVATLATATPIANSVGEAYTMLRYLRPDLLEDMGVDTFDEFAANFGEIVSRLEVAPTGGLRQHARFAKFVNLPELLRPWLIASDVKTAEDLKDIVKVPDLVERVDADGNRTRTPETVVVPPSAELKKFMELLVDRAKTIPYPPEKGGDNMLRITGEGRAAALDLRMVGRDTDEPTKLDIAAGRITAIYEANKDRVYTDRDGNPVGGAGSLQLVFSDIGTPTTGRGRRKAGDDFSAYEALRDKLVERGIPRSKVRFIHEADTDQEKAELFAAARDGRVAVLVGSTAKMGVGTNVQDRAVAEHHLDVPWRPADVQQREGRLVRQNNKNAEVEVIRYVTEESFDAYIWQAVTTKATFINQIMRGRLDVREMDDVGEFALTAAEVTALGTGNRWLIEHTEATAELTRLQRARRNHEADQRNLTKRITAGQDDIARSEQLIAQIDEAIPKRVDGKRFRIMLGDTEYKDRSEAQKQLRKQVQSTTGPPRMVGQFRGFPLRVSRTDTGYSVELDGVPGTVNVRRGNLREADILGDLQGTVGRMERTRARHVARIGEARQDIEALRGRLGRPFRDEDALEQARERFERVDANLRAELERRGETLEPTDPVEKAAARKAAEVAAIKTRLDAGEGFQGLGELTTWLEADEELARRIPDDAGTKWGVLSPRGQLLVMKNQRGSGYNIYSPRTMRGGGVLSGFRTQKQAKEFAARLEDLDIPWNTKGNLAEWRAPDGATAAEVVATLRGQDRDMDQTREWKEFAAKSKINRLVPDRLHQALLTGQYRGDNLGVMSLVWMEPQHRDEIIGMLQGAAGPDDDLATAVRLRDYGLAHDDHRAQQFALAAAKRLGDDYRQRVPQPLDPVRARFQRDFEQVRNYATQLARIDQILAEGDATGDLAVAAAKLRAFAAELGDKQRNPYGSYGLGRVADVAGGLADALEQLASQRTLVAAAFDPNQPRAPRGTPTGGQWVGSPPGGGGVRKLFRQLTDAEFTAHQQRVQSVVGAAVSTLATDRTHAINGGWKPERDRLHREIAAALYARAADVPNDRKAVMAGGLSGSGKSTVLRDYAGVDPSSYLTVNPDDIKEELARRGLIPEIPDAPDLSPLERAPLVHEESSRIAHLLADMAYREGKNLIWDITMSSIPSTRRRLDDLDRAGYTEVVGVFVDIPAEVAVKRALGRYRDGVDRWARGEGPGGRFVPPDMIRAHETSPGHTANRDAFDDLRDRFSQWVVYDNSVDGQLPRLVERS
jgi:N12 class adenine-specific DNA methylase/predicted ABC-type ATPase